MADTVAPPPVPPQRPPRPPTARKLGRDARELAQARELTANLVRRDLKVRHRGTFLGMLWSLANPLLLVVLYYGIFKYILGASPAQDVARPDGHAVPFAIYFFSGLTLWNLFSNSLAGGTGSVVGSGYLLRKVYFPRAILPLSVVLASVVTFTFELTVLMLMTLVLVGLPGFSILWLPVIVAITALVSFGFALFLSAVTVFLRDMSHFVGVLLQLWFWTTPILYSLQFVSRRPAMVRLLKVNPMTGLIVSFRNVVVLDHPPDLLLLGYDLLFGLVMLAIGMYTFQRWQRLFSEIV
ncbi:MAG: ABC transporter permease [Actinomycetota bacterium]|nr:ABC transporter permease [Actinomycetota bacterium]